MLKIIGLVGETGAGKDYFYECIKKLKKKVFCFRFSDPLKQALKIFLDDTKKEDLQWLAIVLRRRFGEDVLFRVLVNKSKNIKRGVLIFNGLRYWVEYKTIKKLGGKIVYITADSKIRWQRVKSRREKKDDNSSYENFLKLEKAKTEILIQKIGRRADFKIENNGSKLDFYQEVKKITAKIFS